MFLLNIADIVHSIASDDHEEGIRMDDAYADFHGSGNPEVVLRVHNNGLPEIHWHKLEKIFDSEMVWSLYRKKNKFIFALRSATLGLSPYSIAIFNSDFSQGDIFCPPTENRNNKDNPLLNPLAYPLAEALMVCLLSQGRGVMMHAGGVIDNGRGYLFAARSGHGKTTMIKLWRKKGVILNDDRIIIRYQDNRFWIHGTPWHGEYNVVAAEKAPLDKIFILGHGKENVAERLLGNQAVTRLMTRCFPPFWDREGMAYTLDLFAAIAQDVPCHALEFIPDEKIVDFVRCVN